MTNEFQNVLYNLNLLLGKEAIERVFGKSETELLSQLLTNITNSLLDTSPNYFKDHLVNIILSAIAFGWKSSKSLEDFKYSILEIQRELEKKKYSSYIQ